jgi:hypothetical protein
MKFDAKIGHSDLAVSAFQQEAPRAFGVDFATTLGNYTIHSYASI